MERTVPDHHAFGHGGKPLDAKPLLRWNRVSLLESLLANLPELSNTVYEPVNAPCHEMAPGAENNVCGIYRKAFN